MKRKRKQEQPTSPADASCSDLVPRLQRLEKAFKDLTGTTVEEYEATDNDPVVETKEFGGSVIHIHQSGAKEFLKKCPWCGMAVGDLATHKARCPKRPIY